GARVEGEKSLVPRSRGGRAGRSLGLEGQERRAQLGEVSLEGVEADAHVVELSVVRSHARAELGAQLFDGSAQRRLVREDLAVLTFEGRRCVGELSHRRGELVPRPVHLFDHGECPGWRPHQTAPIPQIEEVGGERRRVRDRVGAVAQGPAGALLGEGATVGIGARSLTWGVHVVSATSGGSREALIAERKGTGGETDGTLPLLRRRGRGRKPTALADRVGNPRRRYAERRACR